MEYIDECVEAITALHQKYDFVYFFPHFIYDFFETIIPPYTLLDQSQKAFLLRTIREGSRLLQIGAPLESLASIQAFFETEFQYMDQASVEFLLNWVFKYDDRNVYFLDHDTFQDLFLDTNYDELCQEQQNQNKIHDKYQDSNIIQEETDLEKNEYEQSTAKKQSYMKAQMSALLLDKITPSKSN